MRDRNYRALVVDDERLARQRLEDLLSAAPGWEIAGTADDGDAAVRAIADLKPDLVFLDVQMPGKTGFEVVRTVGPENMPATIFVTAFDKYALKAFDVAAIDYLVKPFDDERFIEALHRAERLLDLHAAGRLTDQLRHLLAAESAAAGATTPPSIRHRNTSNALLSSSAARCASSRPPISTTSRRAGRMRSCTSARRPTSFASACRALDERLDPEQFFRIHRSAIVKLDRVDTLLREPGGDYAVKLKSGARLSVSRNRVEPLERWMGITR